MAKGEGNAFEMNMNVLCDQKNHMLRRLECLWRELDVLAVPHDMFSSSSISACEKKAKYQTGTCPRTPCLHIRMLVTHMILLVTMIECSAI